MYKLFKFILIVLFFDYLNINNIDRYLNLNNMLLLYNRDIILLLNKLSSYSGK